MDAVDAEAIRGFDEHGNIVDVHDALRRDLGDVQREPEDVRVGLADVDEAGRDEEVYKSGKVERSNTIRIQLARFVADDDDLQPVWTLSRVASAIISGWGFDWEN